ncbi:MAG: SUF system Fe-S cluster assembly protein [Burkholderiales bacterium]|nr:SUF system Fe-S cluster assembly protein [Burkholderiales bacterium]MDQ3195412.1 SUF system Fe-S cluster assembly protein [Pseudomonadota bacterium]
MDELIDKKHDATSDDARNEVQEKSVSQDEIEQNIISALREVYDPEIPVNIYDLGLIYAIDIEPSGDVHIQMTLTAPGCPVAQTFPATVEDKVNTVSGVSDTHVELVWEPPWSQENMSEAARLQLGML